MDITRPLPLLGGLSPETFMRRHWHKRPLLVRQAMPGVAPPLPRRELFALAARDDVESRLVEQRGEAWHVRQGPLARRALPPLSRDGWTLLVQGLDLHNDAAHELLSVDSVPKQDKQRKILRQMLARRGPFSLVKDAVGAFRALT